MATEYEYNAAWRDGNDVGSGEHGEYYDYGDGYCGNVYNYAMTNEPDWSGTGRRYSTMLTKTRKVIIAGPKYFPSGMCGDEDSDIDDGETSGHESNEPNSKCKRTANKRLRIVKVKVKTYNGIINVKNKKAVVDDKSMWRGDGDIGNTTRLTTQRATQQHDFDNDDEVVRDAAAAGQIFEDEWTGVTTTSRHNSMCNIHCMKHNHSNEAQQVNEAKHMQPHTRIERHNDYNGECCSKCRDNTGSYAVPGTQSQISHPAWVAHVPGARSRGRVPKSCISLESPRFSPAWGSCTWLERLQSHLCS